MYHTYFLTLCLEPSLLQFLEITSNTQPLLPGKILNHRQSQSGMARRHYGKSVKCEIPHYCIFSKYNTQGWRQEFSDGGLTRPTRGLKYGFQGTINVKNLRKSRLSPSDGGYSHPSPPLAPPPDNTFRK